jgi:hypothetical protein
LTGGGDAPKNEDQGVTLLDSSGRDRGEVRGNDGEYEKTNKHKKHHNQPQKTTTETNMHNNHSFPPNSERVDQTRQDAFVTNKTLQQQAANTTRPGYDNQTTQKEIERRTKQHVCTIKKQQKPATWRSHKKQQSHNRLLVKQNAIFTAMLIFFF